MKPTEAIYVLKNAAFLGTESELENVEKAIKMATRVLEKQIPQNVGMHDKYFFNICPRCKEVVLPNTYCGGCGQRISFRKAYKPYKQEVSK